MTEILRASLVTLVLLVMGIAPALAKDGDDKGSTASFEVTQTEAIEIAVAEGIVEIREVKARRGVWKIEGADSSGAKLEVEIDGETGEVVKRERYLPGGGNG